MCIFETSIDYFIKYNQIPKYPKKVQANLDVVQRFLGLITYYTRFILNALNKH